MLMRKGQDGLEQVPGQKGGKKPGKEFDLFVCWVFIIIIIIIYAKYLLRR